MNNFSIDEYLKDLAYIVNIDSGHFHEPGTNAVADYFKKKYEGLGFKTEIKCRDGHTSTPFFCARNSDSEKIDVLIVAHMDTVFAPGTAAERPFSIDEAGHGRGPGCLDCKGGCVLAYYLLKHMKEAGELNFNVCVAMNSDEEKGSQYSRDFFEELAQKSGCCFVFEPGRAHGEFVSQRKGGYNYIVRCKGIPAHSGADPEKGASAILELSKWVSRLYAELFKLEEGTSINIGRFAGGADNGSVPEYAEFTISLRCLDFEHMNKADELIMSMESNPFDSRCKISVERKKSRPPMTPNEETYKIIHLIEDVCREVDYSTGMLVTGGGSDGNFIAPFCPTVDGCGPCGSFMHVAEEYVDIESIEKRLDILHEVFMRLFNRK